MPTCCYTSVSVCEFWFSLSLAFQLHKLLVSLLHHYIASAVSIPLLPIISHIGTQATLTVLLPVASCISLHVVLSLSLMPPSPPCLPLPLSLTLSLMPPSSTHMHSNVLSVSGNLELHPSPPWLSCVSPVVAHLLQNKNPEYAATPRSSLDS